MADHNTLNVHTCTGRSQVWLWNFPLGAYWRFCSYLESTNPTHPHLQALDIALPCSHFSFLVEYSQKTSHQPYGEQAAPP